MSEKIKYLSESVKNHNTHCIISCHLYDTLERANVFFSDREYQWDQGKGQVECCLRLGHKGSFVGNGNALCLNCCCVYINTNFKSKQVHFIECKQYLGEVRQKKSLHFFLSFNLFFIFLSICTEKLSTRVKHFLFRHFLLKCYIT